MPYALQAEFNKGELSPRLQARIDLALFKGGAADLLNWYVQRQGGVKRRPGTDVQAVAAADPANASAATRLFPFILDDEHAYVVEAVAYGDGTAGLFRFYTTYGLVMTAPTDGSAPAPLAVAHPLTADQLGDLQVAQLGDSLFMVCPTHRELQLRRIDETTWYVSPVFWTDGPYMDPSPGVTTIVPDSTGDLAFACDAEFSTRGPTPPEYVVQPETDSNGVAYTSGTYPGGATITANYDAVLAAHAGDPAGWALQWQEYGVGSTVMGAPFQAVDGDPATWWQGKLTTDEPNSYLVLTGLGKTSAQVKIPKVIGCYAIQCAPDAPPVMDSRGNEVRSAVSGGLFAPRDWTLEGYDYDTETWVTLDQRVAETGWGTSEWRYYSFGNERAWDTVRLNVTKSNDSDSLPLPVRVAQFQVGAGWQVPPLGANGRIDRSTVNSTADVYGDGQAMQLQFSDSTDTNGGAGFTSDDVGRLISCFGSSGQWHGFEIVSVDPDTQDVRVRCQGYPLPDKSVLTTYRLGAWGVTPGYPTSVGFYQDRHVCAGTAAEPDKLWFSQTGDYYNWGVSTQLVATDAFNVAFTSFQPIQWLFEGPSQLFVGTTDAVRNVSAGQTGFSATSFQTGRSVANGASDLPPIPVSDRLLFVSRLGKVIREISYKYATSSFVAPDITVNAEHMFRAGIVRMVWAPEPNAMLYVLTRDGRLVAVTYDPDQETLAFARWVMAAGGLVEDIAVVPGPDRYELWLKVNRGGVGTIERLAADYEEGDDLNVVRYMDSCRIVLSDDTAANAVSGMAPYDGVPVAFLADGSPECDLGEGRTVLDLDPTGAQAVPTTVVPSGDVAALPSGRTANVILAGLPYVSVLTTLRPYGQQDGQSFGRRSRIGEITVDVLDGADLWAMQATTRRSLEVIQRDLADDMSQSSPLFTGASDPEYLEGSWADQGQVTLLCYKPRPCTVRAVSFDCEAED